MLDDPNSVVKRYEKRRISVAKDFYSLLRPANLLALQERHRATLHLLSDHGYKDFSKLRLLEVGAGSGGNLLDFIRFGFDPDLLQGVELLPDRVSSARHVLPDNLRILEGDASVVEIEESSLDLVYQSVVFSSLLDTDFQHILADRMWSLVRPGGAIIWYDFIYNNPCNHDVVGVPLSRVKELFPLSNIDARRLTLAPPIARRVCQIHPSLYTVFNVLPLLRTHLLCWIEKP
jgi:SAM-dependent methyltransferase